MALLLIGVALLVLPGPGFLLIAGALALLSTQFAWARKPLDFAKDKAEAGIEEVAGSRLRTVFAVCCGLVLVAIGIVDLAGVDIPWVNRVSAILLILSGLFLVGTLVYALRRARQERLGEPAST
jgi:hypothetical protein